MFGGALWGAPIGNMDDHLTKERNPPPRPFTPEFPAYIPSCRAHPLTRQLSSKILKKICHTRSFADITDDDLELLNISYEREVPLDHFAPSHHYPVRPFPFDEDLDSMLKEISVSNEDAFREVLRMQPLPGRTKPRLTYARNFFGSLEDVARYWDNSKDEYYFVPVTKDEKGTESTQSDTKSLPTGTTSTSEPLETTMPSSNMDTASPEVSDMSGNDSGTSQPDEQQKEVYKGYRFGNGEQLSTGTRVALVKNFLKMVMHKYHCRDHEPMPAPREKLVVRGVKIASIQYHFCVARIPTDTKQARSRLVEGPIMAAHVRDEVKFRPRQNSSEPALMAAEMPDVKEESPLLPVSPSASKPTQAHRKSPLPPGPLFLGEHFDMFREIGCMLVLATQRAREGKDKGSILGADRWWVTEKRWGGGPAHWGQLASEVFEDEDPSWSPAERLLQEEKRKRDTSSKDKGKGEQDFVDASRIGVDDLMANNAPSLPNIPGEPLIGPRKKKLRSLERPADKDDDPSQFRDGKRLMYVPPFRKRWYQEWLKLKPNTSLWDDKIIYKAVGKDANSQFDDVYMVNCANHHICLTHMKVHPDYLKWLEEGKEVSNETDSAGLSRNVLYVKQSRWYDMLDVEARKELLTGLWRVMSWINRDQTLAESSNIT